MAVDTIRHYSLFDPDQFGARRVSVVGTGAVGSRLVLGLAKLGIQRITTFDHDKVEGHNVANQVFGLQHVGMPKVQAIAEIVQQFTGTVIDAQERTVTGKEDLGQVVFLAVDTMKARKEIWEQGLKNKFTVEAAFEGRMGKDSARVYWVQPIRPSHVAAYEKTLYADDGLGEVSPCGAAISVGPTAEALSAMMQWAFMRWFASVNEGKEEPENELIFGVSPLMQVATNWAA